MGIRLRIGVMIRSIAYTGSSLESVEIEVDFLPGTPFFNILGLPDISVRESRERLRAAITNAGFVFPLKHIIINLLPGDVPKEGNLLELGMAVAILSRSGQIPPPDRSVWYVGGLALDGRILETRLLTAAILQVSRQNVQMVLPASCLPRLSRFPGLLLAGISHLADLQTGVECLPVTKSQQGSGSFHAGGPDMDSVRGHDAIKVKLAQAIAGSHHTLLFGAPGSGKTMLIRAAAELQPPLSDDESLEVSSILAANGDELNGPVYRRPFRTPHHTASDASLVGGGSTIYPGEVALAHRGILFLDEMLEFRTSALQALREPLEDRTITISRARSRRQFPTDFLLLAATNPCMCGKLTLPGDSCSCRPAQVIGRLRKIDGPLLDRISIQMEVVSRPGAGFIRKSDLLAGIERVRAAGRARGQRIPNGRLPEEIIAQMTGRISGNLQEVFESASPGGSFRAMLNTLRLAITIADWYGREITKADVSEALSVREFPRLLHLPYKKAS